MPNQMPHQFWEFVREYLDPIDEDFLQRWWLNVAQPFFEKTGMQSNSIITPKSKSIILL